MKYLLTSFLLLTLCFSCSNRTNNAETYQSALLQIQAKDKSYKDITSDTIIFAVKEYYAEKKDFPNATLAAFYSGRVLHEQKDMEKATSAYLEAEKYADYINDNNLKGLIQGNLGTLFYEQLLKEKAVERWKKAAVFYHKAENYKNEVNSLLTVGNCFLLKNENDSALYYYNKGLKLVDNHGLQAEQTNVKQCIGVAYQRMGNYLKAKKCLQEALAFSTDSTERARIFMNLASVFQIENQIDSAQFYIKQSLAIQAKEPALLISTYLLLSEMEEKEGRYQEALQYFKTYNDYVKKVVDDNKNKALLELQEKYDFETIEKEKKQLTIEKQKLWITTLITILLGVLVTLFFYFKYIQKKKKVSEIEQKKEALEQMVSHYSEKEKSTKNTLIRYLDILKKVALINEQINEEDRKKGEPLIKKFNRIIYEQETFSWDLFFQCMNEVHEEVSDRIRKQYPQLTDSEFQICCMLCENFSSSEIAVFLNLSANTVHKKISILRQKIGVPPYANMIAFLTKK